MVGYTKEVVGRVLTVRNGRKNVKLRTFLSALHRQVVSILSRQASTVSNGWLQKAAVKLISLSPSSDYVLVVGLIMAYEGHMNSTECIKYVTKHPPHSPRIDLLRCCGT